LPNCLQHAFNILEDIVVPEAQDREAIRFERHRARSISIDRKVVLASIEFDNEPSLEACKVQDEITVRVLAAELAAFDLTAAQALPKPMLGIGWRVAQTTL
jgi:hypothetical protein